MDSLTLPAWSGLVRGGSGLTRDVPFPASGTCAGRVVDLEKGSTHAVIAWQASPSEDARLDWLPIADQTVDLTDETSRCHVAWWVLAQGAEWSLVEEGAIDNALSGSAMSPEQIATLRGLALRLHADMPEQQEARTQRMLADWPETFARLAEGPGNEGGGDV